MDAVFLLAVANNGIAIEKPDGMAMPYLAFSIGKSGSDFFVEKITDNLVCFGLGFVIGLNFLVHGEYFNRGAV